MSNLTFGRWLLTALSGLFLGGIIHIFIVMAIPTYVPDVAFERIGRLAAGQEGFIHLPPISAGNEPLPMLDPAMTHAACRYRLEDGPIRLEASIVSPFWSFALFNRRGETIYSFNDRTSGTGRLTMLVLTPQQLSVLRERPPADLEEMIVIETEENEGFALLRAFVPDEKQRGAVETSLQQAVCKLL